METTAPASSGEGVTSQNPDPESDSISTSTQIKDFKNAVVSSFTDDSHDIAHQQFDNKGEAQMMPREEIRDLGWHKKPSEMSGQFINGIPNDTIFAMIRRFNKDVFDVEAMPPGKSTGLDLTEAWDNNHASDKMTLHLQRAYLSIILGLKSFGNHVARLRSWKETRRTAAFCTVYSAAWALNLLIPLLLGTLMVIIGSEKARNTLFPPVPLALVNISTGGLQKPPAGELGTTDTITGAPEKAKGEAREEEAANFVENARHLFARSVGMNDGGDDEGNPLQGKVPKPVQNALKSIKEAGSTSGHVNDNSGTEMTQKPMEDLLWETVQPKVIEPVVKALPHMIGEIVDNWERFANAISPTPPFSHLSFLRLEGALLPLFLTSLFVPQYLVCKTTGFAIGFILFGDPVISRGLEVLNEKTPNWLEMLEPKNNILRGIPTNNQITLTLLRIGEAHRSPLPPIPDTKPTDLTNLPHIETDNVPLEASQDEIVRAVNPIPTIPASASEEKPKHRHLSRFISVLKGQTKAVVETKLAVDHVRAKAGSEKAKGHLGILQKSEHLIYAGPAEFKARFNGHEGWLYISNPTSSLQPRLILVKDGHRCQNGVFDMKDESAIEWSIKLRDIHRLERATALASLPAEKAAQWSKDTVLLASLEIIDEGGKSWRFTAIPERDELFNRLVAIGGQRWLNM
ncbi:hypothetical protein LSUE1_G007673 [Lachnellula suecica]|uniref:Proteasome subunit beta type protein n=1 Tax=Lachnellula suecica TaxID=602035 RepID=A0A8T9BZM8_9HELO|nr:hypothetical protein LSUE1_G007673 [Lachnellula suecica]